MYMTSENEPVPVTAWAAGEMKASSPPDSMENRQKDKPTKGKKGKAARTLLRRVCKAVKRPFFACCDPDRVVCLTPQTDALDDTEVTPVPGPSRITPTADADPFTPDLVCLPGQVCEYPESPSCVPGSSGIKHLDPENVTDSSSLNLCDKKAKKGRKRKAVRAFFRRACEAVKQLFPCTVRPPKAEPDHVESQFVPEEESLPEQDQVSTDLESVPVEEGPSEIEQEPEDVVLPGSVSSSVSGSVSGSEQIVSEAASDTEPEPEIELPQGSIVSLYEVGHLIASGKFSKVYEGTHVFSEKLKVAIKDESELLDDDDVISLTSSDPAASALLGFTQEEQELLDEEMQSEPFQSSCPAYEELLEVMERAMARLDLPWKRMKKATPRGRLDERFLSDHNPPAQVSLPFLPDLHTEVVKGWSKPFSSRIHRFQ
ncbi:Zinc metalloprotease ZmpB [Labeo rohita]|uniref:Zinc metalloprotease ZmpB n=1 Tax=Labeo rohita TaxID=84645 RepID=A0ABQ8L581_LABRO|nr:Zinc metalloprotease ZmpB [Labeo rohita]